MEYLQQDQLNKLSVYTLPIEKGDGMSPRSAYVLQDINQFEAPSVEYLIIDLTLKASGYLLWHLNNQTFTIEEDREIDCLKVSTFKDGKANEYSFYFDLTRI